MTRSIALCLLGMALAGCASLPPPPAQPSEENQALFEDRITRLTPLNEWSIRGRVAVYVDEDVYNLGLSWRREGDISSLKFEASLGQGLVRLEKTPSSVELTTAEGERRQGQNAEQILYQTTGLTIPVEGLETWIKGIPHTATSYQPVIDANGRAQSLLQDGWYINYLDYEDPDPAQAQIPPLPRKLYMKHDRLALKIVIDQWQNPEIVNDSGLFPTFPN